MGRLNRPQYKPITHADLRRAWEKYSAQYEHPGDACLAVASAVLNHHLGPDWVGRFVQSGSEWAEYLRVDLAAPVVPKARSLIRFFEFAETLLNLQHVEGFETCLDQLTFGQVESACSELDAARLLAMHEVMFSFVSPLNRRKGEAYDLKITYPDGLGVPAEVECKFGSTPVNARSVLNSLQHARKQLPKNSRSVILFKVPEHWLLDRNDILAITGTAEKFLHSTTRVASVKFYATVIRFVGDQVDRHYVYREISNPKFSERDWDILTRDPPRPYGMPNWWIYLAPTLRVPD